MKLTILSLQSLLVRYMYNISYIRPEIIPVIAKSFSWRLRLLPEHRETTDRIAKRPAEENIRGKMGGQGESGESDERGRTVGDVWNPSMVSVAPCDDRCNREGGYGVT